MPNIISTKLCNTGYDPEKEKAAIQMLVSMNADATLLSLELTTICQPVKEMVEKAVELIVNNELTGMTGSKFVFPVSLVVRQTTKKKGETQ